MNKIIFSPHVDDAMFSLGGAIINWVEQGLSVRIINVFSNSVSSRGFGSKSTDKAESLARIQEEQSLVSKYGPIFEYLNYNSSGGRGNFFLRKLISAKKQMLLNSDKNIKKEFENYLRKQIFDDASEIFIPLVPQQRAHIDHLIVRNTCLEYFSDKQHINLYEELPYCNIDSSYEDYMQKNDITPILYSCDYAKKSNAISAYQTELRPAWKVNIEKQYNSLGGERVWLLDNMKKKVDFLNF